MAWTTVMDYQAGLRYVGGRYRGRVGPGRFWTGWWFGGRRNLLVVDVRTRALTVPGQEIVTKDKVEVRLTLAVQYRVADPEKALREVENYQEKLYQDIQLPLRAVVAQMEIDAVLESKEEIGKAVFDRIAAEAAGYGVEVKVVGVKDIILPGELRKLMNRVVEARKQAQAALIAAREEAAILRTRMNTLQQMKENPQLLDLLKLEAMKEIARSGSHTFVVGEPAPGIGRP